MKRFCFLLIVVCSSFGSSAMATDYYVNPTGNDLWSGTIQLPNAGGTNGPFKTLQQAQQAIRTLKKTNQYTNKVTVNIASGNYYLSQPLDLSALDSGLLGKEITWQGELGAQVTLSGGLPVTCSNRDGTFWDCPVTTLPVSTAFFDVARIKGNGPKFELFVDDQKQQLARWPDTGWAHIKVPVDTNTKFSVMETMPAFSSDIYNAQVHIFPNNDWYDQYLGVSSIIVANNEIHLSSPSAFTFSSGRQFYLENILSEFNAPGEWFYDSIAQKVTFIASAGTIPQKVILSSLPKILQLNNTGYLSFKNLTFQHSTSAAISSNNSSNIILDHLNINNVGGKAIEIWLGTNFLLSNNEIHHTGGGAVYIMGGDRSTLISSGNIIDNNYFHDIASTVLTTAPAINVNGVGAKVTHNLIEQTSNTGIVIYGNNHIIEKNELHHLCLGSADCGAIYSSADWTLRGNIIRNNYIHDIIGYGLESVNLANNTVTFSSPINARGIYIDDGASGFEIAGNILENAGVFSIHINGGRDNNIHDNFVSTSNFAILIDNREAKIYWPLLQARLAASPYQTAIWMDAYPQLALPMNNYKWPEGNHVEENVLVSTSSNAASPFLKYFIPAASTTIANNIIWPKSGGITVISELIGLQPYKVLTWPNWVSRGVEKSSIYADPCVSIINKQLITCETSALNNISFSNVPSDIGLIK